GGLILLAKVAGLSKLGHVRQGGEELAIINVLKLTALLQYTAESLHLRQLLAAGMPPGEGPLAEAAPRYLAALEANSSWTYSQKKHVVLRLIELARYFAKQPGQGVKERGSPFAPLFDDQCAGTRSALMTCFASRSEQA
ncbi:uncharacterized protein HaLaN_00315, partial [Haematococcus lacustris]